MGDTSGQRANTFLNVVKALEGSPKGRLRYDTGWDAAPNAITSLITAVQESEIDGPNREIVERCYRVHHLKERLSLSPKSSLNATTTTARIVSPRGRHSLPGRVAPSLPGSVKEATPVSPLVLTSFAGSGLTSREKPGSRYSPPSLERSYIEPRIKVEEVGNRSWSVEYSPVIARRKKFLSPPAPTSRRRKSVDGSPNFKPSPSLSSSTQTQTHSSTTSDATLTPTRNPPIGKPKKYGINDEGFNEEKLEEDLLLESKITPFSYIEAVLIKYEEEKDVCVRAANEERVRKMKEFELQQEKLSTEELEVARRQLKETEEALKRHFVQLELQNLEEVQVLQKNRLQIELTLKKERQTAVAAAEQGRASRKAVEDAEREQELLRLQKAKEDEQRRKEQAVVQENERLQREAAEQQRIAEEAAAAKKLEADRKKQVVPELHGLILKEDLTTFARTTEVLRMFEEPVANIDGKDPRTKAFYVGAVKCINTPLNALADTAETDIIAKVEHFSKLMNGDQVSGGGSMTTLFSCKSVPNGELFVMKTLAFRFVKKSEADVTRGTSTVQPLATVGVYLCKRFPTWAALVQANMYKLCPFLVPFSFPQGDKSILEYAKDLGHDLSGSEAAIQQTLLERIKGYCTLYALMVLKFNSLGTFDLGEATDFFTIGGAWQILAKTAKLDPQVDVTATVIHTLLEILDDKLFAVYQGQFSKLMRLLIFWYIPKIKNITPPAKSGSISRLQIYLEKKFSIRTN